MRVGPTYTKFHAVCRLARFGGIMFECDYCGSWKFYTKFICECGQENEVGGFCVKCSKRLTKSKVYCAGCKSLKFEFTEDGNGTRTKLNKTDDKLDLFE